ncbi:MAG: hypothetical protein COA43_00730 [Robiginitomaculum sp.]|nr:MAG: hypothetical protein COA43_00730 [Robiginitomaculum sp.]
MSADLEASNQYTKTTRQAVTAAHCNIETVTLEEMKKAGHIAPKKIAKIIRLTTDTLGSLEPGQLELLAKDPKMYERRLLEFFKASFFTSNPQPQAKKTLIIGAKTALEPLTYAEARAPLTENTEIVGEDDPFYSTLSTVEVGDILKISRTTVIQWIDRGKIIGIKGAKRGWRIPKAQIQAGRLAPRLKAISAIFDDSEAAWHFLVSEQLFGDKRARPIDLLFKKEFEWVTRLAEGYGSDFL